MEFAAVSVSVCMQRSELAVRYISNYVVKYDFLPCSLYIFCVNNRLSLTWSFVVVRIWTTQISRPHLFKFVSGGSLCEAAKHCVV